MAERPRLGSCGWAVRDDLRQHAAPAETAFGQACSSHGCRCWHRGRWSSRAVSVDPCRLRRMRRTRIVPRPAPRAGELGGRQRDDVASVERSDRAASSSAVVLVWRLLCRREAHRFLAATTTAPLYESLATTSHSAASSPRQSRPAEETSDRRALTGTSNARAARRSPPTHATPRRRSRASRWWYERARGDGGRYGSRTRTGQTGARLLRHRQISLIVRSGTVLSPVFSAAFPSTRTLSPPIHSQPLRFLPVLPMHTTQAPAIFSCREAHVLTRPVALRNFAKDLPWIAQVLKVCGPWCRRARPSPSSRRPHWST